MDARQKHAGMTNAESASFPNVSIGNPKRTITGIVLLLRKSQKIVNYINHPPNRRSCHTKNRVLLASKSQRHAGDSASLLERIYIRSVDGRWNISRGTDEDDVPVLLRACRRHVVPMLPCRASRCYAKERNVLDFFLSMFNAGRDSFSECAGPCSRVFLRAQSEC